MSILAQRIMTSIIFLSPQTLFNPPQPNPRRSMFCCARGLTALAVRGMRSSPFREFIKISNLMLDIYQNMHYIVPMTDNRYRKSAHAVFNLKYHFVCCPKYRRSIFTGKIAERLKELLYEKAEELEIEIESMEIMPDHVHLFFRLILPILLIE